jgi:hypothetical protein
LSLLTTETGQRIELNLNPKNKDGTSLSQLILKSEGWASQSEAEKQGNRFSDVLALSLVRHLIGVELWYRPGRFFSAGLEMLERQIGGPVLNDHVGLTVRDDSKARLHGV